jgi:hypothetical protein
MRSLVMACKECVLAIEYDWTDASFDNVSFLVYGSHRGCVTAIDCRMRSS